MPETSPSGPAASSGQPAPPPAGAGRFGPDTDWPALLTERIVGIVGTLRNRTTVPVTKIARAVVFGLLIAVMAAVALVLGVIGVLRLHVYLPFHPESRRMWVTYVGLGAIFMLAGALAWRKRTVRTKE